MKKTPVFILVILVGFLFTKTPYAVSDTLTVGNPDSGSVVQRTVNTAEGTMATDSDKTGYWTLSIETTGSIVGTWSMSYDWDCDGSSSSSDLYFNNDYTLTCSEN